MGATDSPRETAIWRIWEGIIATVAGGLILWFVTSLMSQPVRTTERTDLAVAPAAASPTTPESSPPGGSITSEAPAPPRAANEPSLASISGSTAPASPPTAAPDGPSLGVPTTNEASASQATPILSPRDSMAESTVPDVRAYRDPRGPLPWQADAEQCPRVPNRIGSGTSSPRRMRRLNSELAAPRFQSGIDGPCR